MGQRVIYLFEFGLYALVLEWGASQVCVPVCTCVWGGRERGRGYELVMFIFLGRQC